MASESVATERSTEVVGVRYARFSPRDRADILLTKATAVAHVLIHAARSGGCVDEMIASTSWALEDMLVEAKELLAEDHKKQCEKPKEAHV